jgi:hypothetical protein
MRSASLSNPPILPPKGWLARRSLVGLKNNKEACLIEMQLPSARETQAEISLIGWLVVLGLP